MSEVEKKKISKSEFLIKKEEIELEYPDVSRMPRFLLAFYSYLGLPRFYQRDKKLGILYVLTTFVIIPLLFSLTLVFDSSTPFKLAGFLLLFMFLILPIIESIVVFKDKRKSIIEKEKLIKLRELFDNYEIDSSIKQSELDYELLHFESKHQKRTVRMAGILQLFLGVLGGHRFYLGDKKGGLMMLSAMIMSQIILGAFQNSGLIIFGLLIYFGIIIVYMFDVFKLEKKVKEYNDRISLEKIDLIRKNSIVS